MEKLEIEINEDFANWNDYIYRERSNKFWASQTKKNEARIVAKYCANLKYNGKYPVKITVLKYFKTKRQDLDNVRIKGVFDGLVKAGVIENDNLTHIQLLIYKPVFDNTKKGLKLIIEEMGDN